MSKDSLIKGTIILALAAFIARFLGLIQRVPLKHLLEDSGMATYGIAYNLYFALLVIATAGIPSALSKLISERTALGQYNEAKRIYVASIWFAVGAGLLITLFIWISAEYYALHIARDADAILAIRALSPALLLFPIIAMMRGYFLGRQMMMAGGLSQIVEQILRVVTAVLLAYFLLRYGFAKEWAIAGASFGGVTGSIGAFMVMLYFWRRIKTQDQDRSQIQNHLVKEPSVSIGKIYRMIFKLSIPISLISIAVPLIFLIDSSTVIMLLENRVGYQEAKETLGILTGRAQSLAGIPPILAIAISQSIIPIIAAAYAGSNWDRVNSQASQAFRISVLSCLPVVLFLCTAARPINVFLFGDALGTSIIVFLVIATMFQVIMMISGAILMSLGQTKAPMLHVFIGVIVKIAGSFILSPWFGIHGIIIATAICFIVIMVLNLVVLKKTVSYRMFGNGWLSILGIALFITILGIGLEALLNQYVQFKLSFITYGFHLIIVGLFILFIYIMLLFKLNLMTNQDIEKLPTRLKKILNYFRFPFKM